MTRFKHETAALLARAKELLSYDPLTGDITRLARRANQAAGSVAGYVNVKGYRQIEIDNQPFLAHRLAYAMHNSRWPVDIIDHINGDKDDNRADNLRQCSNAENVRHRTRLNKNNTSGAAGVHYIAMENKWYASIKVNRRSISLGRHDTFDGAVAARKEAEVKYFGAFAPGGRNGTA